MISLSLQERKILLFLAFLIFLGVAVGVLRKVSRKPLCCADIFLKKTAPQKFDINKASQGELESLTGIGEKTAKVIIEYRSMRGNFSSIDELKNIKGITDTKLNKFKDNLFV